MNKEEIVKNLAKLIPGSKRPFLLFSGPSGSGKTWSAQKLADELGYQVVESFEELESSETMYSSRPVLVMLEELQGASKKKQENILEKMNEIEHNKGRFECVDISEMTTAIKKIIIIICTTDKHKILDPIVRRCTVIDYPEYNELEIKEIVTSTYPKLAKDIIFNIVGCCKLNVRTALSLAEQYLIFKDLNKVLEVRYIDSFGLSQNDKKYLFFLYSRGTMSVDELTSVLSLPNKKCIEQEIEPYFKKISLIETATRGRELTRKGKKFVEELRRHLPKKELVVFEN